MHKQLNNFTCKTNTYKKSFLSTKFNNYKNSHLNNVGLYFERVDLLRRFRSNFPTSGGWVNVQVLLSCVERLLSYLSFKLKSEKKIGTKA